MVSLIPCNQIEDTEDGILNLERRRVQLEETVTELRKSLQYWQTWEAEYEGFKEEIMSLGKEPAVSKLEEMSASFGGDLLNEKEIETLLKEDQGRQRSASQVLGLLRRRIDYVQENVKTVNKRLLLAVDQLSAADVFIQPKVLTENGLPITEIMEELDEDGNVVSSSTSDPGEATNQFVEALRKAAVRDLPDPMGGDAIWTESAISPILTPSQSTVVAISKNCTTDLEQKIEASALPSTELRADSQSQKRKRVSFAHDTKAVATYDSKGGQIYIKNPDLPNNAATSRVTVKKAVIKPVVRDVPDQFSDHGGPMISASTLINESPKDATLRRQMLQYNMNEVGAIVAEIDIEDCDSLTGYSGEDEDNYDSNTDEDEDEFGRTQRRVVDNNYRRQMLELEQKLNAELLENVGPSLIIPVEGVKSDSLSNVDGNISHRQSTPNAGDSKGLKKGVRFAEALDISKAPISTSETACLPSARVISTMPISNAIVEKMPSTVAVNTTASGRKASKFKASRTANTSTTINDQYDCTVAAPILQPATASNQKPAPSATSTTGLPSRTVPSGPPGRTHAETLVERPVISTAAKILEPDEFDPNLMQQQLAVEYHRLRNRMIQRNGGFMQSDDEPVEVSIPDDDDEAAGRRVSRFKAARLAQIGQ